MTTSITRRSFIHSISTTVTIPTLIPHLCFGAHSPNEKIQLGFIGVGKMSRGHLGAFLGYQEVQVVAVCDVVKERRENAQKAVETRYAKNRGKDSYKGCDAYTDFRELLEHKGLDAVVVGTPDHWHAIPSIFAAKAGKHIYCEKPLTHNIVEGRKLVTAVTENKVIFQTGSQQRSEFGGRFRQAVEWIRNGRIGKVHTIRIGVGGPPKVCDLPEQPIPAGTDWDLWLGPAPVRGYNEILCPKGIHNHFPAWRSYLEYAGGGVADMGAHHFDIAQWALGKDNSGPVKIEPPADGAKKGLKLTYEDGTVMYHGGKSGCTFEGSEGTIYVDRGTIQSDPASILKEPLTDSDQRVYHSTNHKKNWIECILDGKKQPICHAEVGHRSASICHLTNIGYRLGRKLQWNPKTEKFQNDEEANKLLWRKPREKWNVI